MLTRSNAYLRYTVLGLLALAVYFFQTTPHLLPAIGGFSPLPLVPLVIVVAMREYEGAGAVFGLACGLLMDVTGTSMAGLYSILLLLVGFACSTLIQSLLNDTLRTALLLGSVGTLLVCTVHWVVTCVVAGLPKAFGFLLHQYLPILLYTMVFLIPLYYLVGWIKRRMDTNE